jgi:hypothetical protein
MSAPAGCPANPFERYGLHLVEEPAPQELSPRTGAEQSPPLAGLRPFHWGLLAGFATLQLAYCVALVQLARWAVGHWIGA